jgi:hypothetical protein
MAYTLHQNDGNRRVIVLKYAALFYWLMWPALVLTVLTSVPGAAVAQEKQPESKEMRIESLIERLASANAPPALLGPLYKQGPYSQHGPLPQSYDRNAQVRVVEAWQALAEQGYDAFPALVKHSDDKRYSHTRCYRIGRTFRNVAVGEVCCDIIRLHVEAWWKQFRFMGIWRPRTMPSRAELPRWWRERKGKTLRDLQIESTSLALEQIRKVYRMELADSDGDESGRSANIEILERLSKQQRSGDRPLRMEGLGIERTPEIVVDLPEGFDYRTYQWQNPKHATKQNGQHDDAR